MTTVMQEYRPIFMAVTFGFLGFAFYLTYRPRRTTPAAGRRASIMTMNKILLWGVAVIAVVFLFFPQAFTGLASPHDAFTADMDRSVITIEGMT